MQLDGAAKTLVTLRVVVSEADLQLNSLVEIAMLLLTSLQKLPQRATDDTWILDILTAARSAQWVRGWGLTAHRTQFLTPR